MQPSPEISAAQDSTGRGTGEDGFEDAYMGKLVRRAEQSEREHDFSIMLCGCRGGGRCIDY